MYKLNVKQLEKAIKEKTLEAVKVRRDRRIALGNGLCLRVKANKTCLWQHRYYFGGKEKSLSIGQYPTISFADAKVAHQEALSLLRDDIDPSSHKQAKRHQIVESVENSFAVVAKEWLDLQSNWSEGHFIRQNRVLNKDLLPYLGQRPINQITRPELLKVLQKIEDRGSPYMAKRARNIAGQVFEHGIITERCEVNITLGLHKAMKKHQPKHFAAITDPTRLGEVLRAFEEYQGSCSSTCNALKLIPLVFVRPNELRFAQWSEINFEEQLWVIPADKMKMRRDHIVPLSDQAIEILRDQESLTGDNQYVFSSLSYKDRPMSDNTLLAALRRMGFSRDELTIHGFRATARTLLREKLDFNVEWIEHQLAHEVKDTNGTAYNRTEFLKERKEMMQAWADYLDELKRS